MELAGRVYQQAGANANANNTSSDDSSSSDEAQEAEFVDKK
jgi:hypothetical protein